MKRTVEQFHRIGLLSVLLFKDLIRRRLTLLLLFVVPALFNVVIIVTTGRQNDPVIFGILAGDTVRMVSRRALSFVFLGNAAVSFLTSILAFYLVHQRTEPDRRLALCGFRPIEIIAAKVFVLTVIVVSVSIYEGLIILPFFEPQHFGRLLIGFILGGLVYSCYGLLVGAISVHELEGLFLIVLLANIDVGWLQNPIYYKESTSRQVIENLPGYFPIQLSSVGAFTDRFPAFGIWRALLYAGVFLVLAAVAFWIRIHRRESVIEQNKQ